MASSQYETNLAKDLQGNQKRASGALWYGPGDIGAGRFLIEAKETIHTSYRLTYETFAKICAEAHIQGKTPAMAIQVTDTRTGKTYEVAILLKDAIETSQLEHRQHINTRKTERSISVDWTLANACASGKVYDAYFSSNGNKRRAFKLEIMDIHVLKKAIYDERETEGTSGG